MKLNPFNKKSSAYYDKVRADHEQLSRHWPPPRRN